MVERRFIDDAFRRQIRLQDGTELVLRLLRESDKAQLARAVHKLSPHSRYLRFLSATSDLSPDALEYLTHTDNQNHLAIVAGLPSAREGEEEGIALARFVREAPGAPTAEAAITVVDDYQGRGLGRLLLAALTLAARERGVTRFTAEILAGNSAILHLVKSIGATVSEPEEGSVLVELPLPELPRDGDWSHLPDGPGAQLLRFAARELELLGRPT